MRLAPLAVPVFVGVLSASLACAAFAKLPPLSDEAKAKAAEAAAKTAWTDKVAAFKLCLAMNKAAANYQATSKQLGKTPATPVDTPACADPGPYVSATAASAPAAAASPTSAVAAVAAKKK